MIHNIFNSFQRSKFHKSLSGMQRVELNSPTKLATYIRPKKRNCLFSATDRKKNRVGRSVKKNFVQYFSGQKCVFYACFRLM